MTITPVIIGGGSGSRLWPLSRDAHPKPFVDLPDGTTLIGRTYARAAALPGATGIVSVINQDHFFLARDCYAATAVSASSGTYLLEPFGRNTAAAVAAATVQVRDAHGPDAVLLILAADHMIADEAALNAAIAKAADAARDGKIVTFGIKPDRPETGYGYIEMDGGAFASFVEKPDLATAERYVASGNHFWNSGMFCFRADTMAQALAEHCPAVLAAAEAAIARAKTETIGDDRIIRLDGDALAASPDISIDYAVMEKARNIACITTDCGWSDVGSWVAFAEFYQPDEAGNRMHGEVVALNSRNTIAASETRLVGLVDVEDLIVIDTADALLVAHRSAVQDVRALYKDLSARQHEAVKLHRTVHRPWGTYTVLEEGEGFKIKRIEVKPAGRLSLQAHKHRSEHWVVVAGTAKVVNGEREIILERNQSTYIPCGDKHRLENPGSEPLVLIEVQSGDYLGEDDIIRFEDVYGRN